MSQGAQYMLNCLPVEMIEAKDLASISENYKSDRVYACVARLEDYIIHKADKSPLLRY